MKFSHPREASFPISELLLRNSALTWEISPRASNTIYLPFNSKGISSPALKKLRKYSCWKDKKIKNVNIRHNQKNKRLEKRYLSGIMFKQ